MYNAFPTAAAAANEPTILSRVDRLDIMMGYLEEIRLSRTVRSSFASTRSSGTGTTSYGDGGRSVNSSPVKQPRRIDEVVSETRWKGSLIERVANLEDRVLKLSMRMEGHIEIEKARMEEKSPRVISGERRQKKKKKELKQLLKSCVKGGGM